MRGIKNFPFRELSVDISAAGDNVVIPAEVGRIISVYKVFLVFAAAVDITPKDGVGGTPFSGDLEMLTSGSIVLDYDGYAWFTTTAGNDFVLSLSAMVNVSGRIYFTQAAE